MGKTATVITVAYLITVVIGSGIAFAVWSSTRGRREGGDADTVDTAKFARRETAWLAVMIAALFALLMGTIFYVPYGDSAGAQRQIVRVTGVQYAWAIEPSTVRAGTPVEFLARTTDVNHGFGVYRGTELVFQAQVIPGRTQRVVHTFRTPGTYEVLCLEFCGFKHHEMVSTLEVVAR